MPSDGEKSSRSSPRGVGRAPWVLMAGAGLELALITIAFGGIGLLVDQQAGFARPVVSAFGGLTGFVLGMIRFIRMATRVSQAQRELESIDAGGEPVSGDPVSGKAVPGDRTPSDDRDS